MLAEFKKSIVSLSNAVDGIMKNKLDVDKEQNPKKILYDFKAKQMDYLVRTFHAAYSNFKSKSYSLTGITKKEDEQKVTYVLDLISSIEKAQKEKDFTEMKRLLKQVSETSSGLSEPATAVVSVQLSAKIPSEISDEIKTDLAEIQNCFNSSCYRSAVILCGRVLETALHRKYYDVTGKDILETSPGIGLGNLIARLKDEQVEFDPGITQQIHLINQIRVFSVHKKQSAFKPSKEQTQAMILYTIDVLKKLF
ncbi:DUF4145 domain-containing protein [Nanoarchaeota archaeon]